MAAPVRIRQSAPKLIPLTGRASPKGSATNPMRGLVPSGALKGADLPNKSDQPQYKHAIPQVHSQRVFGVNEDML